MGFFASASRAPHIRARSPNRYTDMPNTTATASLGDPQNLLSAGARHARELSLLARYHSVMLFGGGIVLSVLIVVAACLVLYHSAHAAISRLHTELVAHQSQVALDLEGKQTAMRRGVIHAELLWQARPAPTPETEAAFRAGGGHARLQVGAGLPSILAAGSVTAASPPTSYARYLGMTELQAFTATASERERKLPLTAYGYSPDLSFLALMPAPSTPYAQLLEHLGAADTAGLIGQLSYDLGMLSDPAVAKQWETSRRILWQPPAINPLTGQNVIKLVEPAFDGPQPFMIFVSDYPVSALAARLDDIPAGTAVALVDGNGGILLESDRAQSAAGLDTPSRIALASHPWKQAAQEPLTRYQDGVFSVGARLLDTGWTLVYAYSWRTVAAALLPSLTLYLTVTVLLLGTLWALVLWFSRKALAPVYRRSQHVFESEHMNRSIIASAQFGVGLVSCASGEALLQNAMMQRYAARAAPGVSLHALLRDCHARGDREAWLQRDRELTLTLDDGRECELLVNIVKTRYHGDDVLLCSFSDATARKDIEKKREDARIAAIDAARAKSVFLASMSHEIRTPLSLVLGHLELLDRDPAAAGQGGRLRTVRNASRALVDLINDILDVSRMESGQMTVERIPFDLPQLVAQVVAMFKPAALAKGVQLSATVGSEVAQIYAGDPTRIRQVLVNLVGNALKFTDAGAVEITVEPARDPALVDSMLMRVRDTGIGMTPEQADRVFTLYAQTDSSINRRYGGSGLGLPISKKLVEMMDGTIAVACPADGGAIFTVTLPLHPCAQTLNAAPSADAPATPAPDALPQDIRVLVVDDHPANRELILDQLAALGVAADAAEGAAAAMRCVKMRRYDMVLTDISMPEINGYALAQFLRERGPRLPVVAVTAHVEPDEQHNSQADFDAVLLKPMSLRTLRRVISEHIPRARLNEEPAALAEPAALPPDPAVLAALDSSLGFSLAAIRDALARADFQGVREQCHSIRGAFAMIGKTAVADLCMQMGQYAAAQDRGKLHERLVILETAARAALR